MRSRVGVLCVVGMFASLSGCEKQAPPGGPAPTVVEQVTITLTAAGGNCTAAVDKDRVILYNAGDAVRWTVNDDCATGTNPDEEGETVVIFSYSPNPKLKWLDSFGQAFRARTRRGKPAQIEYRARARGQTKGAEAKYSIYYDGKFLLDPKVVWGK